MEETAIQGGQPAAPQAAPVAPVAPVAPAQPVEPAAPAAPIAPAAPAQPATPAPAPENERTQQQFEKLLESNRRLYEANELLRQERQRRSQTDQQFAPITEIPAVPNQPQVQRTVPQASDFVEVDPRTGERFINEAKFQQALTAIQQKATRAEEVVQNYIHTAEQREVERQNREAFTAYPELNPGSAGFDMRFNQQVRAQIYDSMMNPQDYGGRSLNFKEAADFVKGQPGNTPKPAAQTQAPQAPQVDPAVAAANQQAKEQAAATAAGLPSTQQAEARQTQTQDDYDRLVMGTRLGSDEALARRLLQTPHKIAEVMGEETR